MDEKDYLYFNFDLGSSLYNGKRQKQLNSVLPFGNNRQSEFKPNPNSALYNANNNEQLNYVLPFGNDMKSDFKFDTNSQEINQNVSELDKLIKEFSESSNKEPLLPYKEDFTSELAKNPIGGMSLDTSLFKLGESIAFDPSTLSEPYKKDAKIGNTTKMVGAALKSLFSMSRSVGAGMGVANRNQYTRESYDQKQRYSLTNSNIQYGKNGGVIEFLKNGGIITSDEDIMVGEEIKGLSKSKEHMANAELEDQEYLMNNDGHIQKVVGKKHKNGGEKLILEEGTKVISDNLKISDQLSKEITDEFGINVNSKFTYAKVVDLFTKKSGIKKLNDEQKVLFKKLKDVNGVEDISTNNINQQFLSEKIKDIEDSKKLIEVERGKLFNIIFNEQEQYKEDNTPKMENGGVFKSRELKKLLSKYNVTEDEALNLYNEHLNGGSNFSIDKFPNGGKFKRSNKYFVEDFRKQHKNEDDPRIYDNFSLDDRFSEYRKLFPELLDKHFYKNENNFYMPKSGDWSNSTEGFQDDYNSYVNDSSMYFKSLGYDSDSIDSYSNNIKFLDEGDTRRLKDGKLGQVATSRSGFYREVIAPSKLEKINKLGVYTARDVIKNKSKLKDILTDKEYLDITQGLDKYKNADYTIGSIIEEDTSVPTKTEPDNSKKDVPIGEMDGLNINLNKGKLNYLAMPDQSTPPPQGVTPHLKIDRRFDRVEAPKLTPEEQLKEIFRSENLGLEKISQLPTSQSLAAISNLTANSQEASNKAISQVQTINTQNQANADRVNIGQSNLEENYRASDALDFERRQLTAVAKTQADLDNYFEFNRKIKLGEFNDRRKFDLLNNLYENYNISSNGGIDFDDTKKVEFYTKYMSKAQAIEKVKQEKINK